MPTYDTPGGLHAKCAFIRVRCMGEAPGEVSDRCSTMLRPICFEGTWQHAIDDGHSSADRSAEDRNSHLYNQRVTTDLDSGHVGLLNPLNSLQDLCSVHGTVI